VAPVVALASRLFETTGRVHELGEEDRELLCAGTRLAGIGMHVDYYNRDRHAEYLVHSGDLHGFSHREIVLLGALVRCADEGSPDFGPHAPLTAAGDGAKVAALAVLLGLARAAYRRRPSPLRDVACRLARRRLVLDLDAGGAELDPESVALERQRRRLESTLGLELEVRIRD
jgi:exopolyphosphatase/guanosine-5'-triphosphate,3'-diphosphate pyrophosphatase